MLRNCELGRGRKHGLSVRQTPCSMPELRSAVILHCGFSSETDFAKWEWLLRAGAQDQWVKAGDKAVLAAPSPLPIPQVQVFAQLDPYPLRAHQGKLLYCMVVQGKEGAILAKLVLREDVEQLADQMYFEAANGYSVVFSGVLRKDDTQRMADTSIPLKRVEELDDLLSEQDDRLGFIPVWC